MKDKQLLSIIKKQKLKIATKRDMPLLVLSIISEAYVNDLKDEIGFSYNAFSALGDKDGFQMFLNSEYIADKTEIYLKKHNDPYVIMNKAIKIFRKNSLRLKQVAKQVDESPEASLTEIINVYRRYLVSLGLINCYLRYVGDERETQLLTNSAIKKIGKERNRIADLYPKIEEVIRLCVSRIGENNGFDGDILRFLTDNELLDYLDNKNLSKKIISNVKQRRSGYFYIHYGKKKRVFTKKDVISLIKNEFFSFNSSNTLRGKTAFPGISKGIVYNFTEKRKNPPKKGYVLVTYMTQPHHAPLIHSCSAIITDEGGILSHASIIARELRKPCIISTKIATKILKTGDYVEVNADKGVVKLIKKVK